MEHVGLGAGTSASSNASGQQHRFLALDSLRGVCACLVVFHHIRTSGWLTNLPFINSAWLFVDFFFVLSGFVIAASYGNKLRSGFPISRYMFLRWGRIYPLHLAVTMAYVALELVAVVVPGIMGREPFSGDRSVASLTSNLLFTHIFGFEGGVSTWNSPSWSIAAEWWAYLLTAFVFAYAGRFFWPVIAILIAVCGIRLQLAPKQLGHAFDLGLYRGLYGFCFGIVGFALWRRSVDALAAVNISRVMATLGELALVLCVILLVSIAPAARLTMLAPPLFVLTVCVFAHERGAISELLKKPLFQWLGILSYSIYLTHIFLWRRMLEAMQVGSNMLGLNIFQVRPDGTEVIALAAPLADLFAIGFLALVVVASWISYSLVERPARDWSRKVAARFGQPVQERQVNRA